MLTRAVRTAMYVGGFVGAYASTTPIAYAQSAPTKPDTVVSASRTVFTGPLEPKNGAHLTVKLLEVTYPPGAQSTPHRHPCGVVGYIVSGQLRAQLKGQAERIYRAGDTFYESPTDVHMVSANDSKTEPVKLLAYFTCDSDSPLSVPAPPPPPPTK